MKTKFVYVVMCLKKSHPVDVVGREIDLTLNWADGMCGVMPVFTNMKDAKKYAQKKYEILKAQIINLEEKEQTD